jgi:hypothetical protein
VIPLINILQIQFPTATFGIRGNAQLVDNSDGKGPFISVWNVPNTTQPTSDQLLVWQTDAATIAAYTFQQNAIANAPIIAQLQVIDDKSIRSIRESDPTYLATLTSQAVALRATLLPTS